MNKTMIGLTIAAGIGLAGCASVESSGQPCPPQNVLVKHRPGRMQVSVRDESVDSCPGGRVTVRMRPRTNVGNGHTNPGSQNPGQMWLMRTDADGETIVIEVPSNQEPNTYKYSITVDGEGTIDPRIVIR